MIKLFATDMDQTFLDNDSQLPKRTQFIIDRLENENKIFIIASGRTLTNLQYKLKDIDHNLSFISDNGAVLSHKGEILFTEKIDPKHVSETIELSRRMSDSTVVLITPEMAYIDIDEPQHMKALKEYYTNLKLVDNVMDYIDEDVVKITTYSPTLSHQHYVDIVVPSLNPKLHGVESGTTWIDITNKGVNKGKALSVIMEKYDIKDHEAVTFGDYFNDLEMIQRVKYGYVVENAAEGLKEHAYEVIGKNIDDAVINKILEHLDK